MVKVEFIRVIRLFFIVLIDFFCWMLVIIFGILFLIGDFYDLKYEVKVWIVVFVFLVNFVINLILYIFFIFGVRRKFRVVIKKRFSVKLKCK